MFKFVSDGPHDRIKVLEEKFETDRKVLENRIKVLEEKIEADRKDIDEIKNFFSNNVRSRNMIIRSYSKNGLVSKFMPE